MNAMRKIIGWLFASGVHKGRTIQTGLGAVQIDLPRVDDRRLDEHGQRCRFSSFSMISEWRRLGRRPKRRSICS